MEQFDLKRLSIKLILGIGFTLGFLSCETPQESTKSLQVSVLKAAFEQYREPAITHRRFKHADLQPLIEKHSETFQVSTLGQSVEGRTIKQLAYGSGETKVLLWSQMHGDESTATMALFDLFNFLEGSEDDYAPIRNAVKENLSLHFIPMVNPDGAARFTRRNAYGIDLNRDAIREDRKSVV